MFNTNKLLKKIGLHPNYGKTKYNLNKKRALIVCTSHNTLNPTTKKTGVFLSELTIPYYEFTDALIDVDICSIKGGKVPIDPISLKEIVMCESDKRFLNDKIAKEKLENSYVIDEIDINNYDIVFISGGFGAAYDLGYSQELGNKITTAYMNNTLIGTVCHGSLGLRLAKDNGDYLVKNKSVTGVTNKQLKELRITSTPLHPETELVNQGANYCYNSKFLDVLTSFIIVDGNIVSGQNQNSSGQVAQKLLFMLSKKEI